MAVFIEHTAVATLDLPPMLKLTKIRSLKMRRVKYAASWEWVRVGIGWG